MHVSKCLHVLKKSCSPLFLDKHEESKQKISAHFCNKKV